MCTSTTQAHFQLVCYVCESIPNETISLLSSDTLRNFYRIEMIIPIANPMVMGMGITLYGNGNGPYSRGNKFPSADGVFILCNSNVHLDMKI